MKISYRYSKDPKAMNVRGDARRMDDILMGEAGPQSGNVHGHIAQPLDEKKELIIALSVAPFFTHLIEKIPDNLLGLTERELAKKLSPDSTVCRLRLSFWEEHDTAINTHREMIERNIFKSVCSLAVFRKITSDPALLAYILTPVSDYKKTIEEILHAAILRMREVVEVPLVKDNKLDSAATYAVIKVYELLDRRINGAVVNKQLTIHRNLEDMNPQDIKNIDSQIKELEHGSQNRNL